MSPDNPVIYGVRNDDVVSGRGKFAGFVEINAVPLDDAIVVIYFGVLYAIAAFYRSIIKTPFTVDGISIPDNGRRSVHVGVFGIGVIIQPLRVQNVFRIVDMDAIPELVFLHLHKIPTNSTGEGIG